ncbi:MAG: bifunctional diguanylate cyclase/phosphodiesterase [Pseudonocardiales bacterium]|nr:bifunctional diguanylate cyclase/phosphodiesterase [Pseudonocardiales bacterium]MBV9727978.1 bifunctional diguanylate cyclase/phosphodiesterase [Pseudonocardiales bacterium]
MQVRWRPSGAVLSRGRVVASTAFVATLTLAAVVAGAAVVATVPVKPDLGTLLGGLALAAAFGIARALAIEVEVRRDTARITPTEIPLVFGLLYFPGPVVLAAYVGVLVIARLRRHDPWPKLLFNASYATLTVAGTDLLARLVFQPTWPWPPRWMAVLAGFVIVHAITSWLTWVFIVLLDHRRPGESARPVVHLYLTGLLNAALGITAEEMVRMGPWGPVLVTLLAVTVAAVYHAYYGLLRDHRDLGVLNDLSLRVAAVGRGGVGQGGDDKPELPELDEGAWNTAMELAREQLNATRVVLHRIPAHGGLHTVVAGLPLPRPLSQHDVSAVLPAGPPVRTGQVRRLVDSSGDLVIAAALTTRSASEVLVAPLRGADQLLGVIEVHDSQSRVRGFGAADVRLVETLASHLATALDNCRLLAQLRHDAYHDSLTNLHNRLGFRAAVTEVLRQDSTRCAVIVIELGLRSSVNDALGHVWGDRVVLGAGERLRRALPDQALTARLEGDTFAALLLDVCSQRALQVAEQVQMTLSEPYPVDKLIVECSAVVGVALTGIEPTQDADILLQRADVALRAARGGEETVRSYLPSMGQVLLRRFQLVTQFRQALDTGQVDVHFQPQLALSTRQVIGVEALVRWHHPEFGMLDPAEFVTLVETTGLIGPLTDYVLDCSLAQCRSWLDRGLSLSVAVNLSARNLADTGFLRRVTEALTRHRVPPELLGFELTESAVMSDPERALPVLRVLHTLGIRIAVDDFGTGYSSLAYLRRLPVDEVKIDKSFVLGLASDLCDLAVVRAIVDLGHSLGLIVVAEGVEQDATRDQLVEMGCDVAQGFLFSRPLGPERFDAWLATRTVRGTGAREETVLTLVR